MISDDDFYEIKPPESVPIATVEHVHQGVPVPKATRVEKKEKGGRGR